MPHSLIVEIVGDWLDSWIYRGVLLLLDSEERLGLYDWHRLVRDGITRRLDAGGLVPLALTDAAALALTDPRLWPLEPSGSEISWTIDRDALQSTLLASIDLRQDSPNDMHCYAGRCFLVSDERVTSFRLGGVGQEVSQLRPSDTVAAVGGVNLSGSLGLLSVASLDDGVSVIDTGSSGQSQPRRLHGGMRFERTSWSGLGLLGTNYLGQSAYWRALRREGRLVEMIGGQAGSIRNSATWFAGSRRFEIDRGEITSTKADFEAIEPDHVVMPVHFPVPIVWADAFPYGLLVETDSELLMFDGMGEVATVAESPVAWRVFPNAARYFNQLHVIKEGAVEVQAILPIRTELTSGLPSPRILRKRFRHAFL